LTKVVKSGQTEWAMSKEDLDFDLAIALSLQEQEQHTTTQAPTQIQAQADSKHSRSRTDTIYNEPSRDSDDKENDSIEMAIALSLHGINGKSIPQQDTAVVGVKRVDAKQSKPSVQTKRTPNIRTGGFTDGGDCCNNVYRHYNSKLNNGSGAGNISDDDHMIALMLQENEREDYEVKEKDRKDKEVSESLIRQLQTVEGNVSHFSKDSPNERVSKSPEYSNSALHTDMTRCYECKQYIIGQCLSVFGVRYHAKCFKCDGCQEPISASFVPKLVPCSTMKALPTAVDNKSTFDMFGVFNRGGVKPSSSSSSSSNNVIVGTHAVAYHKNCARELYAPRCCLCSQTLEGTFYKHPFFVEHADGAGGYCAGHQETQDPCCSCGRLEPLYTAETKQKPNMADSSTSVVGSGAGLEPFVRFPDGRLSCYDCISTAVLESSDAKTIYLNAVNFMEQELELHLPAGIREIPILAVDINALNAQTSQQSRYAHGVAGTGKGRMKPVSITRGLTISQSTTIEHYDSIQFPNPNPNPSSSFARPMRLSSLTTVLQPRVEQVRSVTAILVLYGLPWDLTAAILAHEAMHAFCKLTTDMSFQLPSYIEEGLCQYISYQYLEHIHRLRNGSANVTRSASSTSSSTSSSKNWAIRLIDYYKYQIRTDKSDVYGRGYREVNECCSKIGLQVTLEEIKSNPNKLPFT